MSDEIVVTIRSNGKDVGKTTIARLLADALVSEDYPVDDLVVDGGEFTPEDLNDPENFTAVLNAGLDSLVANAVRVRIVDRDAPVPKAYAQYEIRQSVAGGEWTAWTECTYDEYVTVVNTPTIGKTRREGRYISTRPASVTVEVDLRFLQAIKKEIATLYEWTSCMSYDGSYVGEPVGTFKKGIRALEHLARNI